MRDGSPGNALNAEDGTMHGTAREGRRGPGIPFVFGVALSLAVAMPGETSGVPSPPQRVSLRPDSGRISLDTLPGRRLIEEFLGVPWEAAPGKPPVDVLIATLPDPFDSHLDWTYDASLESIIRAFEAGGFVLDRFWIPGARDSVTLDPALHRQLQCGPHVGSKAPTKNLYPGALLFRADDVLDHRIAVRLHLVFLVPETPTGGVYRCALWRALEERRQLLSAPDDGTVLRIVGPAFSGSAVSLRRTLEAWLDDPGGSQGCGGRRDREGCPDSVSIISGTATAYRNIERLSRSGDRGGVPGSAAIAFTATINPDDNLDSVLGWLRDSLDIESHQIALLVEGTTSYGQALGVSESTRPDAVLQIPFPMNIWRLRSEYERLPRPVATDELTSRLLGDSAQIALSLEEPERARETPSPQSRLTVPAMDVLVEQIVRTLKRHRIRLVGLLATDVRDKIFLAEALRRRLPDVMLYTYESNALYLRADRQRSLRGMFVLSTYPLLTDQQRWEGKKGPLLFLSDGAAGTFNAVLRHLGAEKELVGYRSLAPDSTGAPFGLPVWVTAVGRSSFVPIGAFSADSMHALDTTYAGRVSQARPGAAVFTPVRSKLWVPLFAALFVAVLGMVCWQGVRFLRRLARIPDGSLNQGAAEWWSAFAALAVAEWWVIGPRSLGAPDWLRGRWWLGGVFVVAAAALLVRFARRHWPGTQSRRDKIPLFRSIERTWLGSLATLLLAEGLILAYASLKLPDPLWAARALQPLAGLSPLLPLAFALLGLSLFWFWQWRWRELEAEECTFRTHALQPKHCLGPVGSAVSASLRRLHLRIWSRHPAWLEALIHIVFALLVIASIWVVFWGTVVEHWYPFEVVLAVAIAAGLTTVSLACWLLQRTWSDLRSCLRAVAELPLLSAFERLPSRISELAQLRMLGRSATEMIRATADRYGQHLRNVELQLWGQSHFSLGSLDWSLELRWGVDPQGVRGTAAQLEPKEPGGSLADKSTRDLMVRRLNSEYGVWLRYAEEYVALRVIEWVELVLSHIRWLVICLTLALLLTVGLLWSYRFYPQGWFQVVFFVLLVLSVGTIFWVQLQLSRDVVVSKVNGTTPGKLDWKPLIRNFVVFGVMPLVAYITVEFPNVENLFLGALTPLLKVFGLQP